MEKDSYKKLAGMLLISFVIMYAVMFLNVDSEKHIYLSMTRMYMALLMVSPMALLMLLMMKSMYMNKKLNRIICFLSVLIFISSLAGLRSQALVGDEQYMKAMIPHHSSAIMTSKHADIHDPELKELSRHIIESQEQEIEEMKQMLNRLEK